MRGILFVVVLAACESKRPEPPKRAQPTLAALPARRAPPPPTLPAPETPRTYKLDREVFLWSFAEASNTREAWEAVADSIAHELASCTTECNKTAWARVLALKNALLVDPLPRPGEDEVVEALPPRAQEMVDALDQYVALGDPTDPDVGGARFLAASYMYRWHQQDAAIERLEAILREHRDLEVAEYAANQLLDTLLRAGRMTELRAWVAELLADPTFLAGKAELREMLERLRNV